MLGLALDGRDERHGLITNLYYYYKNVTKSGEIALWPSVKKAQIQEGKTFSAHRSLLGNFIPLLYFLVWIPRGKREVPWAEEMKRRGRSGPY